MARASSLLVAGAVALVLVSSALGAWAGKDPAHNVRISRLPSACTSAPTGKICVAAAVRYLNKARASVGLPAYALPPSFASMSPARQMFILVNLDRVQYGLPPIPGMTAALNRDALTRGVWADADPTPSNTAHLTAWLEDWAGSFLNAPMAYEAWLWDDGPGSGNADCTSAGQAGCWGHRHTVLWKFKPGSVLAMGAAAGRDKNHDRGYAMLLVSGDAHYAPEYTYTWAQAVAAGAGG